MRSTKIWMGVLGATLALLLVGCDSGKSAYPTGTPERALKDYIEKTFQVKETSDRQKLASYLTGGALERFEKMDAVFFNQRFVTPKRKFSRLAFEEIKRIDDSEVQITYQLEYEDQSPGYTASVVQRKLCTMSRTESGWKLSQVRNLNENVEYLEGMKLTF
jgi:hypothetical protein